LELGNKKYVLEQIKNTLDQHVGQSYEAISREIFLEMARRNTLPVTSLGRWWAKNEEIDLVALDEESRAIWFGACKWSGKKIGTDVYQDLRRKSERVERHAGKWSSLSKWQNAPFLGWRDSSCCFFFSSRHAGRRKISPQDGRSTSQKRISGIFISAVRI
jgi:hypothetical protein